MHCDDTTPSELLNQFHDDIVSALSGSHIPRSKHANHTPSGKLPGWTELVEPYSERTTFWHNIWKDNETLRIGILANIQRQTGERYHVAIKHIKHNSEHIRAENMANALCNYLKNGS